MASVSLINTTVKEYVGGKMKYIVVCESGIYSSMFKVLFNDLLVEEENAFVDKHLDERNPVRRFIFKVLYKHKVNKYLKNCFEPILKPKSSVIVALRKLKEQPTCVIFNNACFYKDKEYYNEYTLRRIKEMFPNAKFVLYFVDSVFQPIAKEAMRLASHHLFDLVYTYSKSDAKKYGYLFFPTPYSKIYEVPDKHIEGVYFCGSEKGRTSLLEAAAKRLLELNISYQFDVNGEPQDSNEYFEVTTGQEAKYEDVVRDTLQYSCILDLIQDSLDGTPPGLSLRVYEALVYGKALITNNPLIKTFKYYNPKYMHDIKDVSEIQADWIKSPHASEYHGQLSPLNLAEDIEKRL